MQLDPPCLCARPVSLCSSAQQRMAYTDTPPTHYACSNSSVHTWGMARHRLAATRPLLYLGVVFEAADAGVEKRAMHLARSPLKVHLKASAVHVL
jgi:hypothetical protein